MPGVHIMTPTWLLLYATLKKNPRPPSPELLSNEVVSTYEQCMDKARNMWITYWAGGQDYDKSLWTYCVYLNNTQKFDQVYLVKCTNNNECTTK